MKLRVRADASKGHMVGRELIPPGAVLPGEYAGVPTGMAWKLEAVPEAAATPSPEPVPPPPADDSGHAWYAALAERLGKGEPSKTDLREYAEEHDIDLPAEPALKSDLVAAIDAAIGG